MSLLSKEKLCGRIRLFSLHSVTTVQQSNLYSTKITHTIQEAQRLTNPTTHKSSESTSNFSDRIKKQHWEQIVWPKPNEIPYQAKVANSVNLIGYVKTPVHFEATSDGNHFAATVISQEVFGEKDSLLIPVVFEGDLAHVVAYHVKENNCVLVSGQLSTYPMPFQLSGSLVKFHVVAKNLNFVEGFMRNFSRKKFQASLSSASSQLRVDSEGENLELVEAKPEKCNEENGESGVKKKDANRILDLWKDLVKNSLQWWDYRDHKLKELVKEKFPDFKHKVSGDGLWINTAPNWVLLGLGSLEFDVKVIETKQVHGERMKDDRGEASWKNLLENPNKWWDNRLNKRYPNAPDFKHKETREGLWVGKAPAWALPKLPPLKDGQS